MSDLPVFSLQAIIVYQSFPISDWAWLFQALLSVYEQNSINE